MAAQVRFWGSGNVSNSPTLLILLSWSAITRRDQRESDIADYTLQYINPICDRPSDWSGSHSLTLKSNPFTFPCLSLRTNVCIINNSSSRSNHHLHYTAPATEDPTRLIYHLTWSNAIDSSILASFGYPSVEPDDWSFPSAVWRHSRGAYFAQRYYKLPPFLEAYAHCFSFQSGHAYRWRIFYIRLITNPCD